MAILITTNYQEISSIQLDYGYIKTYVKYVAQHQDTNITTYMIKAVYYNPDYNVSFSSATLTLDEEQKSFGYTDLSKGQTTLLETLRDIQHNPNGTSPTKNIATSWSATYGGSGSTSADIYFPTIQQYAQITNATNFTDESAPTLTFTNYNLYDIKAFMLVGQEVIMNSGVLPDNTTSYTFQLNSTHRNRLRELCTGKTLTVELQIQSFTKGTTSIQYASVQNVVMSMVNANPTFTYTVQETNAKVISLLGSSSANTIIENASVLEFDVTPTTYKYATVKEVWMGDFWNSANREKKTTAPYTFNHNVLSSNEFYISVTDSRDFTTQEDDDNRTLLNYQTVKINNYSFKRQNPTSSNIILNLESVYYSTVGSIQNSVTVKWKLDNGSYTTIPSSNYVIDTTNHTLKINNYTLSNVLNYQNSGQFTIYIEDQLTIAQDSGINGKVLKGIPTFDAGEHDLKVNGTLYIADQNGENKINVKESLGKKYSTTEKVIGEWIDGKPLYRKVVSTGSLPNSTTKRVSHSISNAKRFVNIYGYAYTQNGQSYPLPWTHTTNVSYQTTLYCDSSYINITSGTDRSNVTESYVILEYTKTTD